MLREAFFYLLGGVTFLPLCLLAVVLHFKLNAPSGNPSAQPSIDADIELTHEKKLAALDLAVRNAAIHSEIEKAKGKDRPQGDATAPPTAKRLGGPATSSSPKPFSSGWLIVRPSFESEKDATTTTSPVTVPALLVDSESDVSRAHSEDEATPADAADPAKSAMPNAGSGYMSQMYRGIQNYRIGRAGTKKPTNDAVSARSTATPAASSATPTGTAGKESFYCILKAPILYLYSSDDVSSPNTECHAAIDLRGKRVSLFVAGLGDTLGELDLEPPAKTHPAPSTDDEQLRDAPSDHPAFDPKKAWSKAKRAVVRDGELFMKRNAIRIVGSAVGRASKSSRRRPQWFLFCKNNYFMEDWYHALLQASLVPDPSATARPFNHAPDDPLSRLFGNFDDPIGPTFSQDDMASLLVSLDSLPDPLPLRWLNALVGRIFFSVYRTAWLEDYIVSKMMKKMNRVKTPGFLGDIKVVEVDVGRRAPGFSRPMLKALTNEGEASMEVAVHYVGEVRITISTTLTLSLGSRFKPYNIPIVLAIVLRSLEGNLLLHVKRPPSNRLWFGFTTMPKMEIDIEPVVSERKVQWGMVTRLIESRLRELIQESIVVPNMDDISFFDTRSLPLRGGIFADAAKKSDMLHTEHHIPSTVPTSATPAKVMVQQERDAKSATMTIKTSDLPKANKVGTASAPISGTATPLTLDQTGASHDPVVDQSGEASAVNTSLAPTGTLRNRKEPTTALKELSMQTARTSSPAAAGLSDLLNRDLAASGGNLSGSPPRQDSQSSKRRTWFGAGPKSSISSIGSSSGLSTLGLSAATLGGRSSREQSSLALGNASIERPSQRPHSASISGKSDTTLSVPGDASTRTVADPAVRPASVLSAPTLSTNDLDTVSHQVEDTMLPSAIAGVRLNSESSHDANSDGPAVSLNSDSVTPSLIISSASEPVPFTEAENPTASAHSTRATLEAPHREDDDRDLVDSPSSLTYSAKSSVRSLRSDAVSPDARQNNSGDSTTAGSAEVLSDPNSAAASRRSSRGADEQRAAVNTSNACAHKTMPPLPPPRKPVGSLREDRPIPRQDAASALSNVQRSRYSLVEGNRGTNEAPGALASSTSAMLLTSWNKAKASMADKESRQAAARDAKDAIKRGWANWNTKRTEARRETQAADEDGDEHYDQAGMTRSQSSRLSLVPGRSAWLASSPPDPTSFGLGFDKSSPEDTRSAARDKRAPANHYANFRANLTDTDDDNASVHSNSSNRQPYRELRASKKVHGFDSSSADRASSGFSSKLTSAVSVSTAASTTSPGDASGWSGTWDADVPSLAPPALAFRNERDDELGADTKRHTLERSLSRETCTSVSPPALPLRKPSSSILSTSQSSGGLSFIPPAPAATTELASASGLSDSDVAPTKPETAASAQISDTKLDSALGTGVVSERRTPERAKVEESNSPLQHTASWKPSRVSEQQKHPAAQGEASEMGSASSQTTKTGNKHDRDSQDPNDSLGEAGAQEKRVGETEQPYVAVPAQVSSPSLGSERIKKQPGRATMMAVPGIPSMQKAGPQSFSAPAPPEPVASRSDAETSPSAFRASSLFKMPVFASPVLTSGAGKNTSFGGKPSDVATAMAPGVAEPPANQTPRVLALPTEADIAAAERPASALGLTQMDERAQYAVDTDDAPETCRSLLERAHDGGAQDDTDTTLTDAVKAERSATHSHFGQTQAGSGKTVHTGDQEVKLAS